MSRGLGDVYKRQGLSCLENAAVIGLPVPDKLKEMLAQLKAEKENKDD